MIRKKNQMGFTLLEVMIATVIMAIAFTAILTSQSQNIFLTIKTKDYNLAGFLAQNKMVDSEHLMEGKPFTELKKEEEGTFEEPYTTFRWKREVKEIQLPGIGEGDDEDKKQGQTDIAHMLSQTITKYLSKSIRELTVTVKWTRSGGEQKVVLSTYLVDLKSNFDFQI